ncbi:MAG: hypothetical protein AAF404_12385 [Pseudomonadota bacterium]
MTDIDNDDQRRLATLSVLLDKPEPPVGIRPTTDELWDWIHGQVPDDRALEIKSHVAADNTVYEEWRQLRLALEETDTLQSVSSQPDASAVTDRGFTGLLSALTQRLGALLRPAGPALATGALCVFAAGIYLLVGRAPDSTDFWQDWQQPKGQAQTAAPDTIVAYEAILAGMQKRLTALDIPAVDPTGRALPTTATGCTDNAQCQPYATTLTDLGQQLVTAHINCRTTDSDNPPEAPAIQMVTELAALDSIAALHFPLQQWQDSGNTADQCNAVEQLIARVLPAP